MNACFIFGCWKIASLVFLGMISVDSSGLITMSLGNQDPAAQPPIVLRDLSLIRGLAITDFDDTSIVLSNGSRLTWDQVLKASVDENRQEDFNRRLEQIGLPLFRLKSRIVNGDWTGAGEIAGPIYDLIASGKTIADIDASYLVCLATMKSRIHNSDRAGGLMPFLNAAQLQPGVSEQVLETVGSQRIPQADLETRLSHELLPVWFDISSLKETDRDLTVMIEQMNENNRDVFPGLTLYLASVKIELDQTEEALGLLRSLDSESDPEIRGWRLVLEARLHQKTKNALNAQTMLEMNAKKITGTAEPVALYYRGINVIHQQNTSDLDRAKAILTLLRIPALFGEKQSDLAAAAIYQSAEIAKLRGRESDAQKLLDELLRRHPRTYHGLLETNRRSGS